jgi:hypothetical protein
MLPNLASAADVAGMMRCNGIRRVSFHESGDVAECELLPKFVPPEVPRPPLREDEIKVLRMEAEKEAALAQRRIERLQFAATEGFGPDDY